MLRAEMSVIGPWPDFHEHALTYLDVIPDYRERHSVLPGINGYAQTEVGYVDGFETMYAKVAADLKYVQKASFRFDP